MKHLMIDLETMGTRVGSAILSIGACYFDPQTGKIGEHFYEAIRLKTCLDAGLSQDDSTVEWWGKQSTESQTAAFAGIESLANVLARFTGFIKNPGQIQVWGNGSVFDIPMLEAAFEACLYTIPWKFWNIRDVRTVVEMGQVIGIDPKRDIPFDGVAHNALADALHQAKYVSVIWQGLTSAYL